jgi:hypothetical protein
LDKIFEFKVITLSTITAPTFEFPPTPLPAVVKILDILYNNPVHVIPSLEYAILFVP